MYLLQNIDSLHSGLLDELYTRGVIDQRDLEYLNAETVQNSRNEKLLSMLGRKSAQQFEDFLSSLAASGQKFVVEELVGPSHYTITQTRDNVDNPGISMKLLSLTCVVPTGRLALLMFMCSQIDIEIEIILLSTRNA